MCERHATQFLEIVSRHLSARIKRHDLALDRFERASRIERPLKRRLQRPDFIDIRHHRELYRTYRTAISRYIIVHTYGSRRWHDGAVC